MESLETGFILMATGMGTVFVLLATLVLVVRGVSKLSHWLTPAAAASQPRLQLPTAEQAATDTELATVIGAAVAAYRRDTSNRQR
jgi:sodium pump decarboxylase gamma subunit